MKGLINDFLSLIYPRCCEACGKQLFRHEVFICHLCRLNLPRTKHHPGAGHEPATTFTGRVPFEKAFSLFVFEKQGRVQKLLHAIKYQSQTGLAEHLGELMADVMKADRSIEGIDVLVPMPLHPARLKQRGYNQAECLARGLSATTSLPLDTASLFRIAETPTQTGKRKYQRWENVGDVFRLSPGHALENKHVLLVDDVITTGATMEAAWLALRHVKNIRVSIASLAFAGRKNWSS